MHISLLVRLWAGSEADSSVYFERLYDSGRVWAHKVHAKVKKMPSGSMHVGSSSPQGPKLVDIKLKYMEVHDHCICKFVVGCLAFLDLNSARSIS